LGYRPKMLWSQAGKYQIPLFCCLQNTPPQLWEQVSRLLLLLLLFHKIRILIRGQSVQGGITASMPGGSWLGALISGYLSDILGRRKAIQVGSVIWCIGSILVCASQNIGMLVVGRFINGLSVGICSAQVPVYITEIAPPSKRGRLVGCQQCE
jgi:MFS family permease